MLLSPKSFSPHPLYSTSLQRDASPVVAAASLALPLEPPSRVVRFFSVSPSVFSTADITLSWFRSGFRSVCSGVSLVGSYGGECGVVEAFPVPVFLPGVIVWWRCGLWWRRVGFFGGRVQLDLPVSPVAARGSSDGAWWRRVTVWQHVVAARVVGCSSLAPFVSGIPVFPVVYLVSSLGLSAVRLFIFLVLPINGDIVLLTSGGLAFVRSALSILDFGSKGRVWRRQSSGLPFERRHRRVKALSRAISGAVASRFESDYLSVARGNGLFIFNLLAPLGLSASRCLASYKNSNCTKVS
ncbi:hypothetical protein F2Q68_00015523 [Brassica cretica]|uniref:Uncharacterized protein n=2 Tax=Brassica cretica TaxID=69181 RepID=A0A8S9HG64_BRACR|nr:hypothetical protein F2Q68_00015523 [Brassica cretica]KAF3608384.1 hypothetical protein DY000_02048132 [Brassica cretica]